MSRPPILYRFAILFMPALWAASCVTLLAQTANTENPFKKVEPSPPNRTNAQPNPFQPTSPANRKASAEFSERARIAKEKAEKYATDILYQHDSDRTRKNPPPFREWTDSDGNRITARLAGQFAGVVKLVTVGGQTFSAPISQISQQDQKYLRSIRQAAKERQKRSQPPGGLDSAPLTQLRILSAAIQRMQPSIKGYPFAFTRNKEGKPLLSWRVHILPFIGGGSLYNLFKKDEPWDSPHNRQLLAYMPSYLRAPGSQADQGLTTFLAVRVARSVIVGPRPGPPARGSLARRAANRVSADQISDGIENTAMLVEVADPQAVPWTCTDDWDDADKAAINVLLKSRRGGFFSVFADGSVNFISDQNSTETVKRLFDRSDGQPLDLVWPTLD